MKYYDINVEIKDEIAYVTLNRPDSDNQFNANLSQELLHLGNYFLESNHIKVIVLGQEGEHFSRGLLNEANQITVDELKETIQIGSEAIEVWSQIPYPIVVAMQGRCDSIALSLASVADIRIAKADVLFSVPETKLGFVPVGGITQRLPRIIGKGPAMSVLLGGKQLDATAALQYGLVNSVFHEESVWEEACKEAEQLASLSNIAMQYTKECLLRGSDLPFEQALRLEIDMYMVLQTGEDRMEGVNAFLEKRAPVFKGV